MFCYNADGDILLPMSSLKSTTSAIYKSWFDGRPDGAAMKSSWFDLISFFKF
jgi:hypothetical protein